MSKDIKDKKSKILIIIAIIAIIGSIIFIIMTINKGDDSEKFKIDGIDITENKDILKDTKVDTLDITNQVLYNRNDASNFSAIIKNNNSKDYYIKELYVIFNVDNKINKIMAMKDTTIKANDQKVINLSFDSNILNTTKIEYELVN